MNTATKLSSNAKKSTKNRARRIPTVKKLGSVRPLRESGNPFCTSLDR